MSKTCAVCKNNPATSLARVSNKETGELSAPVPLCKDCLDRIAKTRKVELVQNPAPSSVRTADSGVEPEEQSDLPLYRSNLGKLNTLFSALLMIGIVVAFIGLVVFIVSFQLDSIFIGISGIVTVVLGCVGAVTNYALSLIAEAIADFIDSKK